MLKDTYPESYITKYTLAYEECRLDSESSRPSGRRGCSSTCNCYTLTPLSSEHGTCKTRPDSGLPELSSQHSGFAVQIRQLSISSPPFQTDLPEMLAPRMVPSSLGLTEIRQLLQIRQLSHTSPPFQTDLPEMPAPRMVPSRADQVLDRFEDSIKVRHPKSAHLKSTRWTRNRVNGPEIV